MKLAEKRLSHDQNKLNHIVVQYENSLKEQQKFKEHIIKKLEEFKNANISRQDFSNIILHHEIEEYEIGGLFTDEIIINNKMIKIFNGDLTSLSVDVIVSSDNNYLYMDGDLASKIREIGGEFIFVDAQDFVEITRGRSLKLGEVAITPAGMLKAKKIFHAVTVDLDTKERVSAIHISEIVKYCLKLTRNARYKSIAFPLIGTGGANFPALYALEIMFEEIINELKNESQTIDEVYISIYGELINNLNIKKALRKITANHGFNTEQKS